MKKIIVYSIIVIAVALYAWPLSLVIIALIWKYWWIFFALVFAFFMLIESYKNPKTRYVDIKIDEEEAKKSLLNKSK